MKNHWISNPNERSTRNPWVVPSGEMLLKRKPVSTKIKKKKEGKTETGSEKIETCFERNETRCQVQTNSEIPEIDLEAKEKISWYSKLFQTHNINTVKEDYNEFYW